MKRKCEECGSELMGRIDKKFCSDGCRNAHHNKVNPAKRNLIRNINNRLRKNYRILDSFPLKDGKTRVSKNRLLDKNFDFDFITSFYTTKKGTKYLFVYDLGYLPLEEEYYLIVKRE